MQKTKAEKQFNPSTAQLICRGQWPVIFHSDNGRIEQTRMATRTIYRTSEGRYFLHDKFTNGQFADQITPQPPSKARLRQKQLLSYAEQFKTEYHELATI